MTCRTVDHVVLAAVGALGFGLNTRLDQVIGKGVGNRLPGGVDNILIDTYGRQVSGRPAVFL